MIAENSNATASDLSVAEEWRRGWPVVFAAGLGYGFGGGLILLLASLFIKPMRESLGWSATAVTIAPIVSITWALSYPFIGAMIDRYGSRWVAISGTIGLALAVASLAVIAITPTTLYTLAAVIGVFAGMTAVPTYARGVASAFNRGLGLALGVTLSGTALTAAIVTPLTGWAISQEGWRAGYLVIAGSMVFIGLPIIFFLYREKQTPLASNGREAAVPSGYSTVQALRDPRLWCYVGSFTLACIPLSGTLGHLAPMFSERGFPLATVLSLGVIYVASMSIGKVFGGFLLDWLCPFVVAAGITWMAAIGSFVLASIDTSTPYPLIALIVTGIAVGQGAEADFIAFFTRRSFGMRSYATIIAIIGMVVSLGLALGAYLYAVLFDHFGRYVEANLIGAACLAVAGLILLVAGLLERRFEYRSSTT